MAKELAESEYDKFHNKLLQLETKQAAEQTLEEIGRMIENKARNNE